MNEVKRRVYRQTVKCPKCNHVFKTKRKTFWISCSYCDTQFKRTQNIVKEEIAIEKKRGYRQKVKCPKCGHTWRTRTRATTITCNQCASRFKRIENIVEDKK